MYILNLCETRNKTTLRNIFDRTKKNRGRGAPDQPKKKRTKQSKTKQK